jgi:hypothetical protein
MSSFLVSFFTLGFFQPYTSFLLGAAFSIQQTREGLHSTPPVFLFSGQDQSSLYAEMLWPLFGALLLYSLLLDGLIVIAAYILGRRRGSLIALFLLALPGIASTFGLWPPINYYPDTFFLRGTGMLGSVWGMFPLVSMGLLTGWSVVVILSDWLDFKDKFRHYYDHLWYSTAILTCLFFVADSNRSQLAQEFQRTDQVVRQASAYLLQQVRDYDLQCQEDPSIGTASCAWAVDVQRKLTDYAMEYERDLDFSWWGPKSSAEIYNPFPFERKLSPEQILAIRREIKAYNDSRCPVERGKGPLDNGTWLGARAIEWSRQSRPSAPCRHLPKSFCASRRDPLDEHGEEDRLSGMFQTVAIASECIIPSLVVWRKQQEKLKAVVTDHDRAKHSRWLFFVLFSLVIGGKIANATSRAMELDKRPEQERRRLVGLLRPVWLGAKNAVRWIINPYIPSPPVDNHRSSTEPLAPPIIDTQHKNLGSNGSHLHG